MQPTIRSAAVRYALALVFVGLAVVVRVLLTPWIGPERYPYITIFAGTLGASVYAGFGPALVASFAAVVAVDWLFIPPRSTVFPVGISGWVGFVTALSMCTLIAMLAERMRRAEERVARADEVARSQVVLQESEARLRAVVATVPTGIVSIDGEGRIRSFNRAAEGMFGHAAAEVLGQNVRVLMPSPDREKHDDYLARYRRTGVATIIGIGREVLGQHKDGSTFPLALTISDTVLRGEHLFTAVLRELTDEKAVQERARTLERRMLQYQRLADIGAVTARIAHDFGNPLAGLAMTAQAMLRRMDSDAALPAQLVRPQTERLLATVRRLDSLLQEFKDFAREQRLTLEPIALTGFLEESMRAWQPEADHRGVTLRLDAVDDFTVQIDRDKFQRVFDNLLKNAFEAVDHGPGEVCIRTARHADTQIRISITDTGPGIPEGVDVFALFETTKPQGTGLGLPICEQIVIAHGGGLDFAPVTPHGTVFSVDLPIGCPVFPDLA